MTISHRPQFHDLDQAAMDAILARNYVGRLAYSFHDKVDIEPINYVYADGVIYGRTAPGSKLATIEHHRWVAFEVDEVEGLFDWRSVVVHGAVYRVEDGGTPRDREAYERTLERLRTLIPETLSKGDPTPFRSVLFRIHPDTMTGREARRGRS